MCSKCRNFTNAPVGQKHRRCSYCGTIIDIAKASSALFDSPEMASKAVKEFNASRGGDEFEKAVERSRERVLALLPKERLSVEALSSKSEISKLPGKQKRLMQLLHKEARSKPSSLSRIEELCQDYELEWSWVQSQLEKLMQRGEIFEPKSGYISMV
ncbi:MAG: hypothetical protein AM326_06755 [Candidatus Thorarchaeota archaeon SMTZ-45]|nr:MAG: hypothetical protein AM326_06755 [Candidatus Thorarchaeota archaeon SMTZ-45]